MLDRDEAKWLRESEIEGGGKKRLAITNITIISIIAPSPGSTD